MSMYYKFPILPRTTINRSINRLLSFADSLLMPIRSMIQLVHRNLLEQKVMTVNMTEKVLVRGAVARCRTLPVVFTALRVSTQRGVLNMGTRLTTETCCWLAGLLP